MQGHIGASGEHRAEHAQIRVEAALTEHSHRRPSGIGL